ncbi:hypothetical protein [Geomonas subterranea]|uniref:hypothetical protein n=1 Tax=Geomonas subterranea TaxID=2847989 RepID=UPI001CD7BAA7|nr:hypothetical protein [Geomonas fuzhouensis]
MTETTEEPKKTRGRGRPAKTQESKVDLKFHLVLLDAEMDVFKAAAEAEGLPSTSIFIRAAIDQAAENPSITKHIPKALIPSEDRGCKKKHYLLLLSTSARAAIDRVEDGGRCEFIRAAALGKVFSSKSRAPEVEAAIANLKLVKGAK